MDRIFDLYLSARSRLSPLAWTLLRVVTGVVMAAHGYDKLQSFDEWIGNFQALGIPAPELNLYLAIAGELGGGLGLILGALTPIASLGVVSTMTVAILTAHIHNGLLAKNNGFEYPLTLLCLGVFFAVHGAGPYSLDALLARMRKPETTRSAEPAA